MATHPTLKVVDSLLTRFESDLPSQILSLLMVPLESIQEISPPRRKKKGKPAPRDHVDQDVVAGMCDLVLQQIRDIDKSMRSGADTSFLTQSLILNLFTKFHRMIIMMGDPADPLAGRSDKGALKNPKTVRKLGRMIKIANDAKWKMMCDLIEVVLASLSRHHRMTSEFVWTEIIQGCLLQPFRFHVIIARNSIILCRILIVFNPELFARIPDLSVLTKCRQFFVTYLHTFVPLDWQNWQEYNDLMTLQDVHDALKLLVHFDFAHQKGYKMHREYAKLKVTPRIPDSLHLLDHTSKDKVLSKHMERHFSKTRVEKREQNLKDIFVKLVATCWKQVLSQDANVRSQVDFRNFDIRQHIGLFGSTACGLHSAGADLDMYVMLPYDCDVNHKQEWVVFKQLSRALKQAGGKNNNSSGYKGKLQVTDIFNCTVPIIKVKDHKLKIEADISFGKAEANWKIVNLLNRFCNFQIPNAQTHDMVRKFIIAVKHWANSRNLNDSQNRKLNSFGWVLMAIRYLQSVNMLPRIHRDDRWEIQFGTVSAMRRQAQSLGALMRGFFAFWAMFDFEEESISLYEANVRKCTQEYLDLSGDPLDDKHCVFVIEDPVQFQYNCAKNIRESTTNLMRIEFYRAMMLLQHGDGNFDALCRKVKSTQMIGAGRRR